MALNIPEAGKPLSTEDMDMIFAAVRDRQTNFPNEPAALSFYVVINGIGERFRQVECIEQEWTGFKKDVILGNGAPTCPNGHSLTQGAGLTIGWIVVE